MADRSGRPVKVLHLISTLDVGGAEQNLFRLVASMDRSSVASEVVCMTMPGPMGRRIEEAGITVHTLKMRKGSPEVGAVLKLRVMANLCRPDVVQCWMYHANLMGMTLLRPSRMLWNIRCSDMDLSHYGYFYRLTVQASARLSSMPAAIITNSHAGRSAHERIGYRPKRWITIPNGFDTDLFRPDEQARSSVRAKLGIPQDAFVIGLIGRLDPMKDHATFFRAAAAFLEDHPGTHFILAGRGVSLKNKAVTDLMQGLQERGMVHLLDDRCDIPEILAALDMATSSSISEGFPNAVGEAMACGLPCAATDAGDTGVLLGDTGILVKRQSPEHLCRAWGTIARMDPAERRAMGMKGRERIRLHYTQKKTTETYEQEYLKIVEPQAF